MNCFFGLSSRRSCRLNVDGRLLILLAILCLFFGCSTAEKQGEPQSEQVESQPVPGQREFADAMEFYRAYEAEHGAYFDAPNCRLHYLSWGEKGPVLVWLHGTYSSAAEIAPFAERLVLAGYRVLAIDYYGHGKTLIPAHDVGIDHVADDLVAFLQAKGISKSVFGGWSRGGSIVAALFRRAPGLVDGMALLDGGSWSLQRFVDEIGEEETRAWMDGWFDSESRELQVPVFDNQFELFANAYKEAAKANLNAREQKLSVMSVMAKSEPMTDGRWTSFRKSLRLWLGQNDEEKGVRGMLHSSLAPLFVWSTSAQVPPVIFRQLSVPMLIIDPTGDFMDLSAQNLELAKLHPSLIQLESYENTGHNILKQQPERFYSDFIALMKRVSRQKSHRIR